MQSIEISRLVIVFKVCFGFEALSLPELILLSSSLMEIKIFVWTSPVMSPSVPFVIFAISVPRNFILACLTPDRFLIILSVRILDLALEIIVS